MKPIELKIKGLNSFLEMVTIDFEYLTKDSLFGIVGQTGCGKTTVVDAITMAMYGEMPRYDDDTKRLKECVNANTDEMYVCFKFQIREGNELKTYTAERKYKKKKDKLNSVMARLVMGTENVTVLADSTKEVTKEVVRITGLTYDDFTRSVVLPQGKFSQFLMLANKERRDMLERIFDFTKYGDSLVRKVSGELNEKKNAINIIASNIAILGDVSEESINTEKEKASLCETKIVNLKEQGKKAEEEAAALTELKNAAEEFKKYSDEKSKLTQKEDYFTKLKERVLLIEKAAEVKLSHIENESGKKSLDENSVEIKISEDALRIVKGEEEDLKNIHYALLLKRETEYPKLVERESRVKQVLIDEEEKLKIAEELAQFETETALCLKEAEKCGKRLEALKIKKVESENEIKDISEKKISLTVSPAYRQGVSKACVLQDKREEGLLKFSEFKTQYADISRAINENKEKLNGYIKESGELEIKISDIEKQKNEDGKNQEEDILRQKNEELLKLANYLEISRVKWDKWEKYKKEEAELSEKIKRGYEEEISIAEKLKTNAGELEQAENKLNKLKNECLLSDVVKKLVKDEPCPVCGSVEHPSPHIKNTVTDAELLQAEKLYKDLLSKKEILSGKREKVLAYNSYLLETIEKCKENIKENEINEQIDVITQRYSQMEAEYKKLTKEAAALAKKQAVNEKLLSEYSKKFREISVLRALAEEREQKDTERLEKTKEELTEMHEILKNLKEELLIIADSIGLKEQSKIEADGMNLLKGENEASKTIGNFKTLAEKIEADDRQKAAFEEKEEKLRAEIVEIDKKIEAVQAELYNAEKRINSMESVKTEKKARLLDLENKINAVTGGESAEKILKLIAYEIKTILNGAEEAGKNLEKASKLRQDTEIKLAGLLEKQKTLEAINVKNEINLKKLLAENGFNGLEEAKILFNEIENKNKYNEEIKHFEEDYISVKAKTNAAYEKLLKLKDEKYGTDISLINAGLSALKRDIENIKTETEAAAKEIAVFSERIFAKTEARKKYLEFNKEKKKLEYEAGLLEDLSGLLKGNKFAEALSYRQLKYIAFEATKRLKKITSGRYSLELQDLEFIIKDDFNGGLRRSPKTLSGGETFMVSLCLSLALSSKIQMKNSAPLEFFFLDEGFGTLDSETTEIVMETLERLRMEKLSVGVITHVEEIKNRLARKLIVMPPTAGGGSRVVLE